MRREKENIVEMNEAIIAGKKALNAMRGAKKALNSLGSRGISGLPVGGFIADMLMRSKLDEAEQKLHLARCQMELFQCELKDVQLPYSLTVQIDDFLTFAEFFFDGIISDKLVQSKREEAKEELDYAIERAGRMVADLQTWEKQLLLGKETV